MSEPMLRGYLLERATKFIDHHFPADKAASIKAGFPEPLASALAQLKPAQWYPRDHCIALHRAIAGGVDRPDATYETLVALGEFMATEATNTYLRLLLRLMTPPLFCKNVPKFWQRDHSSGEFEVQSVDANAKRIEMRLSNVGGFDHVGPCAAGFLRFGMKSVGADARFEQVGWTMSNPGPAEIRYHITWT
jgi:hypothetical protein